MGRSFRKLCRRGICFSFALMIELQFQVVAGCFLQVTVDLDFFGMACYIGLIIVSPNMSIFLPMFVLFLCLSC